MTVTATFELSACEDMKKKWKLRFTHKRNGLTGLNKANLIKNGMAAKIRVETNK